VTVAFVRPVTLSGVCCAGAMPHQDARSGLLWSDGCDSR